MKNQVALKQYLKSYNYIDHKKHYFYLVNMCEELDLFSMLCEPYS